MTCQRPSWVTSLAISQAWHPSTLTSIGLSSPNKTFWSGLKPTCSLQLSLVLLLPAVSLFPIEHLKTTLNHCSFHHTLCHVCLLLTLCPLAEMKALSGIKQYKLSEQSYPSNAVSTLTSILTGTTPSKHGIIQEAWFNKYTGIIFPCSFFPAHTQNTYTHYLIPRHGRECIRIS